MTDQPHNRPSEAEEIPGFLLNIFHRTRQGKTVVFAAGRLHNGETFAIADDRVQPVFYVRASDGSRVQELVARSRVMIQPCAFTCMDGQPVLAVTSADSAVLKTFHDQVQKQGLRTYEGDVAHYRHYMMARELRGSLLIQGDWAPGDNVDRVYVRPAVKPWDYVPNLSTLSIDIETDMDGEQVIRITAIALIARGPAMEPVEEIHVLGMPGANDPPVIRTHQTEETLLFAVIQRIRSVDPDIITGWNVIDFDMKVLHERTKVWKIPFVIGRSTDESWYQPGEGWGQSRIAINGRVIVDAMHLVRSAGKRFDDFSLNTVATALLGRGKTMTFDGDLSKPDAISAAFQQDRQAFCDYCLEDARLVLEILEKEHLLELAIRRSQLTGMPMDQTGSIAPFEFLYMSELHRRHMVAPTVGVDRLSQHGSPGGLVISPRPGLYKQVFVFDFKSLYPSIIRTFNIDPLAQIQAPASDECITTVNGARFSRAPGILPTMLDTFFQQRQTAKEAGNDIASYTYKIIMNSFYGVLGTDACRFSDGRLVSAITETGHYLLRWARQLLEANGCQVLYGDTDSLFVDAGLSEDTAFDDAWAAGTALCDLVNRELAIHLQETYRVTSKLELEFETLYSRLLLPPARGDGEAGRAKSYAGLSASATGSKLEIKGLEAIRRDWTDMAHHLQEALLKLIFTDAAPDSVESFVTNWVDALRHGDMDDDLVYRKSLRKAVESYTKTTPPHVKAARLLDNPRGVIHYLMTTAGPQPVSKATAPIDYKHYIDKQVEPIVRTISQVYPIDADRAITGEQDLFSL